MHLKGQELAWRVTCCWLIDLLRRKPWGAGLLDHLPITLAEDAGRRVARDFGLDPLEEGVVRELALGRIRRLLLRYPALAPRTTL